MKIFGHFSQFVFKYENNLNNLNNIQRPLAVLELGTLNLELGTIVNRFKS